MGMGGEWEMQRRRLSGQEPRLMRNGRWRGGARRGRGRFPLRNGVSGMSGRGRRCTGVRQTETRRGRGQRGARRGRGGIPVLRPM